MREFVPHTFAIVPAAGHSRRMGRPKLLLPFGSSSVIETVLAGWRASRIERVIAVVRRGDRELAVRCRAAGAEVVLPESDPPDMKDSVQVGLRYVQAHYHPPAAAAWLVAPADLPGLSAEVIDRLLETHASQPQSVIVPVHQGRRGHPVLFAWNLATAIEQLGPDEGVNQLLKQFASFELPAGPACLSADLDTPEEYRRQRPL